MEPLSVQYTAYNQRRLHYSLLFWACLALQFMGILLVLFFGHHQKYLNPSALFGCVGVSSFLMAFIGWRLHGSEVHYENLLRNIENQWMEQNVAGIQKANVTGKSSSRKAIILVLACLAIVFCGLSLARI